MKPKDQMGSVAGIGLDVHYEFSTVTMRDSKEKVVCRERLEHRDREALRRRLAQWPPGAVTAMEGSFGWGWLSDELLAAGLDAHLSSCFKVEQLRQARGQVHTNRKDADLLSLLPLERTRWWEVWRATKEVRDHRELTRYWIVLRAMAVEVKNRLHALCHRHGIFYDFPDLFGGKGRAFLAEVAKVGQFPGGQLGEGALFHWRGQVKLFEHLREQLADLTRELRRRLARTDLIRRLDGIPGIGLILSHVLMAEIGQIARFANSRCLARYCLLAPQAYDTGQADPARAPIGRHLGKKGNHVLKWAMILAARGAVRKGGKWRKIFDRYTAGGRQSRNRGYIKVAREMVAVVDVIWRKNVAYTDTPPARPGSVPGKEGSKASVVSSPAPAATVQGRARRQAKIAVGTRSGTGQL